MLNFTLLGETNKYIYDLNIKQIYKHKRIAKAKSLNKILVDKKKYQNRSVTGRSGYVTKVTGIISLVDIDKSKSADANNCV